MHGAARWIAEYLAAWRELRHYPVTMADADTPDDASLRDLVRLADAVVSIEDPRRCVGVEARTVTDVEELSGSAAAAHDFRRVTDTEWPGIFNTNARLVASLSVAVPRKPPR